MKYCVNVVEIMLLKDVRYMVGSLEEQYIYLRKQFFSENLYNKRI